MTTTAAAPAISQASSATKIDKTGIERFYRVFKPCAPAEEVEQCVATANNQTLFTLYNRLLEERYIPLKNQKDIYYPMQRSKEWFTARKKVPSTITGSRPSGWFFGIKSREGYEEHLGFVHLGIKQQFTAEAIKRMNFGTKFEDYAQQCFLEYMLSLGKNMYVYETGFQRNTEVPYLGSSPDGLISEWVAGKIVAETDSHQFKGQKDYLIACFNYKDELDTYVIHGYDRINFAINKAKDLSRDEKAKCNRLLQHFPENTQWRETDHAGTCVYGAKFSILEIKCPEAKIYSSIPAYYLCQLHSEMAAYNMRKCYFTCWHQKDGKERLRAWELTFNDAFWKDFVKIVDLFRMKNKDGSRGISWTIFKSYWFTFKRQYSSVAVWKPFVTKFFQPRKYCIERPYTLPKNTSTS